MKKGIVNQKDVAENTTRDTDSEEDELVIGHTRERISEQKGIVPDSKPDESGLEIEREDPEETITHPFNPEQIKINTRHILVEQFVSRIKHKEIDLAPDFQRLRGIWKEENRSRLIESLLLRIPIPVFYVAADEADHWAVVDGVQRISTIYDYVTGVFPLTRLEYLTGLDGQKHDALPRPLQRRISETQLIVNIIEPGTPPEVMFNVFRRINTGGMMLNRQEIRHALNPGPVRDYLKTLTESAEFIKATDSSIKPIRMADRECVLRFLAFYVHSPENYATGDLDGFLGNAMQKINKMSSEERDAFAADFKKAMRAASDIFGEYAFRKRTSMSDRKRPISKILFEVWSAQLARCSPDQIRVLVERREDVQRRFMQLIAEDDEFEKAISLSTNTVRRVQKRFRAIKQLVEEFI